MEYSYWQSNFGALARAEFHQSKVEERVSERLYSRLRGHENKATGGPKIFLEAHWCIETAVQIHKQGLRHRELLKNKLRRNQCRFEN